MPLNTQTGVSGAAGVGRVQIGFDGNRLNLSGATTISNTGLSANVFTASEQPRRRVPRLPGPRAGAVPGPGLRSTDRPANGDAVNVALTPGIPAFVPRPAATSIAPGSTDPASRSPLATAAQAPGGTITGLTSVPNTMPTATSSPTTFCSRLRQRAVCSEFSNQFSPPPSSTTSRHGHYLQRVGIQFSGLETGPGQRRRQPLSPDAVRHHRQRHAPCLQDAGHPPADLQQRLRRRLTRWRLGPACRSGVANGTTDYGRERRWRSRLSIATCGRRNAQHRRPIECSTTAKR